MVKTPSAASSRIYVPWVGPLPQRQVSVQECLGRKRLGLAIGVMGACGWGGRRRHPGLPSSAKWPPLRSQGGRNVAVPACKVAGPGGHVGKYVYVDARSTYMGKYSTWQQTDQQQTTNSGRQRGSGLCRLTCGVRAGLNGERLGNRRGPVGHPCNT